MFKRNRTIPLIIFDFVAIPTSFVFKFMITTFKIIVIFIITVLEMFFMVLSHTFHWIALAGIIWGGYNLLAWLNEPREYRTEYYDDVYYDDFDIYKDTPSNPNPGIHYVEPYTRSDGTEVRGHYRSNPDGDPTNNLNSK